MCARVDVDWQSKHVCVFITAVPITKLFAWGERGSGGHVLRETTSRGLSGLVCPSRTSERGGERYCVKGGGGVVLRAGRRRGGNLVSLECLMEAVELRENQLAVAVVLGACVLRLRVCACVGRSSSASGWRGRCLLIGTFVVVQEVLVRASERAKGRGIPAGGVLEVGARQPHLLSGASKGAQEGYKPGVGRV